MIIREPSDQEILQVLDFIYRQIITSYDYVDEGRLFNGIYLDFGEFASSISSQDVKYLILIDNDGQIKGTIASSPLTGETQEIHSLYVAAELRGIGYGHKLLVRIEAYYPPNTIFCLDVLSLNTLAINFYFKHGYSAKFSNSFPFRWDTWPNGITVNMTHLVKNSSLKLPSSWKIGFSVLDDEGQLIKARDAHGIFETSSTIKTPITYYFMQKITKHGKSLTDVLPVKNIHLSNGSGIVNWAGWKELSIDSIINLTCKYSDCVTANMMIDYTGGKQSINKHLMDDNYIVSKQVKDYIVFATDDLGLEHVGTSSPLEAAGWMADIFNSKYIRQDLKKCFLQSTKEIDTPWFNHPDPKKIDLHIKTGSMIRTDDIGTTVFNVVGTFIQDKKFRSFAFFSTGRLIGDNKELTEDTAKNVLTSYILSEVIGK